jgi:hypothetical protein
MNIELLIKTLGWLSVINYSVLVVWFLALLFARQLIYKLHKKLFDISSENFDLVHYCLIGGYKLFILVFFISPYIALKLTY